MKNVKTIEIEIKDSEWTKSLDEAFKKKVKNTKIDGFRKGAITKEIYLKKFGIESLYMDAVDAAAGLAYTKLLTDNKIIPVVEPKIDIKDINQERVIFSFTIITKPEVSLSKYTKLGVKKEAIKVTKEEITAEITKLADKFADIAIKENGQIVMGNTAVIDFEGFIDGKPLEGGSGANYPLEIGSHTFIPGFEEGLVGMKSGETKELDLKFPENYTPELKDKEVKFKVKVIEIKERILPALNETFYQDLGFDKVKTEAEFNTEIENSIKARKEAEAEDKYINDCLEAAAKNLKVEINEEIISDEVHRMIRQFEEQIKMQGLTIEQYLEFTHQEHQDLHKQMEPEATKRVKYRYLLEAIADKEKFIVTDEEANTEAENMALQYGMAKEEFLANFGGLETVKYDVRMHKAIEFLKEN